MEPPADTPALQDAAAPGLAPAPDDAPARRGSLFWWVVAGVVAADQATKALLRSAVPLYDSRSVVPGFLDFVHVRNEGVAFGLLNQAELRNKWLVTTGLALLALVNVERGKATAQGEFP